MARINFDCYFCLLIASLNMWEILIFIFLANPVLSTLAQDNLCYVNTTDEERYSYFSSKTSYFTVENEDTTPIEIEGNNVV